MIEITSKNNHYNFTPKNFGNGNDYFGLTSREAISQLIFEIKKDILQGKLIITSKEDNIYITIKYKLDFFDTLQKYNIVLNKRSKYYIELMEVINEKLQ